MNTPYDAGYYESNQQSDDRLALWWYSRVVRSSVGRGKVILDFGCGTGHLLKRLSRTNRAIGFDQSSAAVALARVNAPKAEVVDNLDLISPASLDAIVSLHVLEHIHEPTETLRGLKMLLRPGGTIFVVVPEFGGRGHRMKAEQWFGFRDPTHVSLSDAATWNRRFIDAGFEVDLLGSDGLWDYPYSGRHKIFEMFRYSLPLLFNVLLGRVSNTPGKGECLVIKGRVVG